MPHVHLAARSSISSRYHPSILVLAAAVAGQASAQTATPGATDLDAVVVTATASERTLDTAPASMSVVTREELAARPVYDLADALRGEPGIGLTGIGLDRRGVSVRGMDPSYTMTLLDGMRVNSSIGAIAHSDYDLGWMPAEAIERVEIVRGPMSSLYGSEALGGVINVISRSATDAWRGSLRANAGEPDAAGGARRQMAVYAGGPLVADTLGLSVFADRSRTDETPDPLLPGASRREARDAGSGSATLSWTPGEFHRIDLRWLGGREERVRHGLQSGSNPYIYQSRDEVDREQWALSHRGRWGWGESGLRLSRASLDKVNERAPGTPTGPQHLRDEIADGHLARTFGERHRVTVGGEWRRESLEDALVNDAGEDEATHRAVFVQDEITLADGWDLVLGDRYDRHRRFGGQHSPRAYLVHERGGWLFKGGAGRGFKAPTLKQLSPEYYASIAGLLELFGNPDLRPEVSTTYELAAQVRGDGWHAQATAFENRLRDLIEIVCVERCGQPGVMEIRTYRNVDRARLSGIELAGAVDLADTLALEANYTYLDARDQTADRKLEMRSHHGGAATLAWTPVDAFTGRLRAEYVGSQLEYPSRGPAIAVPADTLYALELSYRIGDALTLRGGVENIGDARQDSVDLQYPYPQLGRSYHVGLDLSF
ncbi:TonB-dependent receptor [Luteimonas sp. RD2P54]|uniref:TonB-dependent receptor n=1 Tax=Luteimonas endophytica TaxID=3042023 RepID=A0ABT6J6V2_9GAMM|nr:TonB-dependent receptor [Luteimonas endophytica]MDH5822567.1 TonB-dependent receptor [Luteimonas endophytica]